MRIAGDQRHEISEAPKRLFVPSGDTNRHTHDVPTKNCRYRSQAKPDAETRDQKLLTHEDILLKHCMQVVTGSLCSQRTAFLRHEVPLRQSSTYASAPTQNGHCYTRLIAHTFMRSLSRDRCHFTLCRLMIWCHFRVPIANVPARDAFELWCDAIVGSPKLYSAYRHRGSRRMIPLIKRENLSRSGAGSGTETGAPWGKPYSAPYLRFRSNR